MKIHKKYFFLILYLGLIQLWGCSLRYGVGSLSPKENPDLLAPIAESTAMYQMLAFGIALDFEFARLRLEAETAYHEIEASGPSFELTGNLETTTGVVLTAEFPLLTLWNWEDNSWFRYAPMNPDRVGIDIDLHGTIGYFGPDRDSFTWSVGGSLEVKITPRFTVMLYVEYRQHDLFVPFYHYSQNTWMVIQNEVTYSGVMAGLMLRYPLISVFELIDLVR